MNVFDAKNIVPMLIASEAAAFDSPDYIYELKLDGVRCLAYLDESGVELRNKRNLHISSIYPELEGIYRQIRKRCILDGELLVMKEGKPYFSEIQRRALMNDPFRIRLAASRLPVSFAAFDLLYVGDKAVNELPLMERKRLLASNVTESDRMAVSRHIEQQGSSLYRLAAENGLEGIVSKRKESLYHFGRRTHDWIKSKNLLDDDFVICGYIRKDRGVISLVLGQYDGEYLVNRGHVTLGAGGRDLARILAVSALGHPPFPEAADNNKNAVWIEPRLVGSVKYMEKTATGSLRQPVFKGLRDDKRPEDCLISATP